MTTALPTERWLFTHPSHLLWWVLPNLEANPDQRPITGVFCVFVDSSPQDDMRWYSEVRTRCELLGLRFALGLRHAHGSEQDFRRPMTRQWQKRTVAQLLAIDARYNMLDMEPYYDDGRRYHRRRDAWRLWWATRVWQQLGPSAPLFVYPMGESYWHGLMLARNAVAGGTTVYGLDASTYNPRDHERWAMYMQARQRLFLRHRTEYVPGFFLALLQDPDVMEVASIYGRCWFYARTSPNHADDLPHFGTPEWAPESLAKAEGA